MMHGRRIGFQGELGAFSEEAVRELYGGEVEAVPLRDFADVGEAVANGTVNAAVLPVENSIAGSVGPVYDLLATLPLRVVAETVRPIRHCLMGVAGATTEGLRRALSHPVALAQCNTYLRSHPDIEAVAVYDTAGAARQVAERADPTVAAIASRLAAERYGLGILEEDIQDRDDNQTRFFALVRNGADTEAPAHAADPTRSPHGPVHKTAVLMETANRPGALVAVLQTFADQGINLTKLESRPAPEPWTYLFILELVTDDPAAEAVALKRAEAAALSLRVLGRFTPWRAAVSAP
jgi:prephenate dehydratase